MPITPEHAGSPWHKVNVGDDAPECFNTVIEIPMGSSNKYELDHKTGLLKLDRVLARAEAESYPVRQAAGLTEILGAISLKFESPPRQEMPLTYITSGPQEQRLHQPTD